VTRNRDHGEAAREMAGRIAAGRFKSREDIVCEGHKCRRLA
jgi:hypothetical protein